MTTAYSSEASRTYTTTYDAAGHAVAYTEPGGVSQSFHYDSLGNLTSQAGSGAAAATATRTFDYDLAGRMKSFSAPSGNNTVDYDDRGLPTAINGPSGNSSFSYTADGLMASRTDAAGTTSYTYDGADRLSTLKNTAAGADLTYAYDSVSAVSQITYGQTGNRRTFGYDGLHRLTSDELKTSDVLDPIRLVKREGNLFTLDNRRLVAFQKAGLEVHIEWQPRLRLARNGIRSSRQLLMELAF